MPMFRMAVKADGTVKPCCTSYGDDIIIGNIYKNTLNEIWNSKFMKKFQKMHINGKADTNKSCLECINKTF